MIELKEKRVRGVILAFLEVLSEKAETGKTVKGRWVNQTDVNPGYLYG